MKSLKIALIMVFSFIGAALLLLMAVQISGGAGMGMVIGGKAKLMKEEWFGTQGVNAINIDSHFEDINFLESPDDNIHVKQYHHGKEKKFYPMDIRMEAGTLYLEKAVKQEFNISIGINNDWGYTEVYLPASFSEHGMKSMEVKSSSGDLRSSVNLKAEDKLSITASSGDMNFGLLVSNGDLGLETNSGDIVVKQIRVAQHVSVKASSGDIVVRQTEAGSLTVGTSSGDINFDLDSVSGDISMSSSSGDLKAGMNEVKAGQNIALESKSGDIHFRIPEASVFRFAAKTNSGDISAYFDDELRFNKRGNEAEGDIGGQGGGTITVKTSSGDIRIGKV